MKCKVHSSMEALEVMRHGKHDVPWRDDMKGALEVHLKCVQRRLLLQCSSSDSVEYYSSI